MWLGPCVPYCLFTLYDDKKLATLVDTNLRQNDCVLRSVRGIQCQCQLCQCCLQGISIRFMSYVEC